MSDIVATTKCGLVVDTSRPSEIAEALTLLVHDADARRRLGENGRRAVLRRYNWELEETKLLALYEGVLRGPA